MTCGRERPKAVADRVVEEAPRWVGTPYRHQGTRRGVGCDCLGLVRGVWRAVVGNEPELPGPYTADWSEAGGCDRLLEAARRHCVEIDAGSIRPGTLILFRWRRHLPARHVGIALGPDRFVHAYEGRGVVVSPLVPQWKSRVCGVFAFPENVSERRKD